jgi:hypothetical protein
LRTRVQDWVRPAQPRLSFIFGREAEDEKESPQTWGFTKAYEVLIDRKLSSIDFSSRTTRPLAVLQRLTGIIKSPGQLWKAASTEFRVPKAGDLI